MQELMTLSLNASHNSSILKPYLEMKMNYDVDRKLQHLDRKSVV